MANLFTNLSGAINSSVVVTNDMIAEEYKLSYSCSSIGTGNSFLLIKGNNTYFFPLQFVGTQEVKFKASFSSVVTCALHGDASISGLTLATYSNVSEGDRAALELVKTDSGYWDRIKKITDDAGKVKTKMLEGLINLTVNAFANESGTITQENGIMTFMNGSTPETSTMAVQITGGSIRVSNQRVNGEWQWRTAITGAGIYADTIIAETFAALVIKGNKIVGSEISGGTITGVSINGSTIVSGTVESGNYIMLDKLGNIYGYKGGVMVLSIEVQNQTNPLIRLKRQNGTGYIDIGPNWFGGKEAFGFNCYGGDLFIDTNAKIHISANEAEFSCNRVKFYGDIEDKYGDIVTGSPN